LENEWVRPTLLVVDDERDVLSSVHDLLRIDYRVITYERGQEALEYLRTGQAADAILCDQRMPEMTGCVRSRPSGRRPHASYSRLTPTSGLSLMRSIKDTFFATSASRATPTN
jgi:CheY-like chemotaxis protein